MLPPTPTSRPPSAASRTRSSTASPSRPWHVLWDAQKAQGCKCDLGYDGPGCAHRISPKGDDPLTTVKPQMMSQMMSQIGGAASGTNCDQCIMVYNDPYGGVWRTGGIDTSSDAAAHAHVQAALRSLPNEVLDGVSVSAMAVALASISIKHKPNKMIDDLSLIGLTCKVHNSDGHNAAAPLPPAMFTGARLAHAVEQVGRRTPLRVALARWQTHSPVVCSGSIDSSGSRTVGRMWQLPVLPPPPQLGLRGLAMPLKNSGIPCNEGGMPVEAAPGHVAGPACAGPPTGRCGKNRGPTIR